MTGISVICIAVFFEL